MNKEKIEISVNEEDVQNIINCYEKDIEYIKQLEQENQQLKEEIKDENTYHLEAVKWYKEAFDLEQENIQLKERINKAIEYINNYDVFKEFSFPLMKRDEENQIKTSIKYEFDTSIKEELLEILKGDSNE